MKPARPVVRKTINMQGGTLLFWDGNRTGKISGPLFPSYFMYVSKEGCMRTDKSYAGVAEEKWVYGLR